MERVYDTLFIGLQDIIRAKGNCHDIRSRFSQYIKRVVDVNKAMLHCSSNMSNIELQ